MDPYIVSARKYRPATFRSVVGQKNLTDTLKNAIVAKRLAQAYLFTGPRGVGKTSCARIFAKTINCMNPSPDGEACGECEACRDIESGNSFNVIELDAASNNSVNDIRNITDQVNVPPQVGAYRVFIIDEVHMLSSAAFNAFLKTLEEPPEYVVFILATTEKHKVLPTILSRCQIYDFKRITIADMVDHLKYVAAEENVEADPRALNVIARKADGAMRDALSIFDQVSASSKGKITYESTIENLNVLDYDYYFRLVDYFRAADVQSALLIYKEIRDKGFDSLVFVNGLASHIRDLMVAIEPKTLSLLEVGEDVVSKYNEQARSLPVQWYYAALKILSDCDLNYRLASSKLLLVELALIRLSQLLSPPEPPFDRVDTGIPLKQLGVGVKKAAEIDYSRPPATGNNVAENSDPSRQPNAKTAPPVSPTTPESASLSASSTVSSRRRGARLKDMMAAAEAATAKRAPQRKPVDPESFMKAWNEFMIANPDRQILLSAMRSVVPVRKDPESFVVKVDHPASRQSFESSMPALLEFIRERVGNDFVTIELQLNEEDVVRKLPQNELLKSVIIKNPVIADFLKKIDAELE